MRHGIAAKRHSWRPTPITPKSFVSASLLFFLADTVVQKRVRTSRSLRADQRLFDSAVAAISASPDDFTRQPSHRERMGIQPRVGRSIVPEYKHMRFINWYGVNREFVDDFLRAKADIGFLKADTPIGNEIIAAGHRVIVVEQGGPSEQRPDGGCEHEWQDKQQFDGGRGHEPQDGQRV